MNPKNAYSSTAIANSVIEYMILNTPLGPLWLATENDQLIGSWFDQQRYFPDTQGWQQAQTPLLIQTAKALTNYFQGQRQSFAELPLAPRGTPFQQSVWHQLQKLPYGTTIEYGQLALAMGRPTATRAIAAAIGRNPLSILIPCHRVMGKEGQLRGYAGGLARKASLLKLESQRSTA